ncbi:MAG: hypothetical protein ABIJ23_02550 [Candidatus Magasanikbacteria bacterium]
MEDKLKQSITKSPEGHRNSILQTLAYFDVFNQPLTKEEIWQFLYIRITDYADQQIDRQTVFVALQSLKELGNINLKEGYYFLPGREELVAKRQANIWLVERKMKKAIKGIKKLARVPFVRAVFVCNTVSGIGIEDSSDIDVLIIVKKGRIFLARAIATFYLSLLNLRRTKRKIKNKICLSFYVADDNLNLSQITLPDLSGVASAKPDIYLMYWLAQLIPVYDPDNLLISLQKANTWVNKFLPNAFQKFNILSRWQVKNNKFWQGFKKFFERVWQAGYGDLLEKQAKDMQLNKMKMNYMSVQNEANTRVIVNDQMLKFHEKDRREEYRDLWEKKCEALNLE